MKNAVLLLVLLIGSSAFAAENHQQIIEMRVSEMVRSFDAKAIAVVDIEFDNKDIDLAMTPFTLSNSTLDEAALPVIKNVSITVYSDLNSIPDILNLALGQYFKRYGAVPKIEMKQTTNLLSSLDSKNSNSILWPLLFALGIAVFLTLFIIKFRADQKAVQTISTGISKLAEETSHNNAGIQASEQGYAGPNELKIQTQGKSIWDEIEGVQLLAMFTDCYWSHEDEYAAYIWSNLPLTKKVGVIETIPFLKAYAEYVSELTPKNLALENDPYYLNPLKLNEISNQEIELIVQKRKDFYAKLPKIRASKLNLKIEDKIHLVMSEMSEEDLNHLLENVLPSPHRKIATKFKFSFSSLEEEEVVLAVEECGAEMVLSFPSLGWLAKLPKNKIEETLAVFSAKELATGWIAPKSVLEKLEQNLSEKKRETLLSYVGKVSPSRDSKVFRELVLLTLTIYQEKSHENINLEAS